MPTNNEDSFKRAMAIYRSNVRQLACRFCLVGPGELCVKPDPLRGEPECGELFLPQAAEGYKKRCTVRGTHATHAALPPHRVEVVSYVHDERSFDYALTTRATETTGEDGDRIDAAVEWARYHAAEIDVNGLLKALRVVTT